VGGGEEPCIANGGGDSPGRGGVEKKVASGCVSYTESGIHRLPQEYWGKSPGTHQEGA